MLSASYAFSHLFNPQNCISRGYSCYPQFTNEEQTHPAGKYWGVGAAATPTQDCLICLWVLKACSWVLVGLVLPD